MVNQLQFTNPQAYSGGADFSPLERLGYAWAAQQKEAQQNEEAYRLMGGGQGQPPQSGGFFQDIGRRFGLIPEQVPGAPPARATAEVPTSPRADGSGIGTMTPNAKSWFNFATRPVADGGLGLSQAQAAGKVANLQAESGANITPWGVAGDQGTAQGSAQWRGDRLRNLVEFSKANGMDYRTTEAQQAFMRHEYLGDPNAGAGGGSEGKAYAALSATRSPQEAATAVNRYYERSADKSGRREAGAARLSGSNAPSGTPVVAQGNMPSSAFSARPPLSAAMVDPNASPLDNAPWPQGNVGAPAPGAVAAGAPAPPLQTAAVPAAPVVASDAPEAKVVQNLVSGQPAAAAGVNREQLAQMYRNPITRPLATAILQKQMDPGSWSYQQVGDRLIAANSRTGETKVVMEDTKPLVVGGAIATRDPSQPGGYAFHTPPSTAPIHVKEGETVVIPDGQGGQKTIAAGDTKAQRELAGNTYKADAMGLTGAKREFMIANGRVPTGDDVPAGDRRQIEKLQDVIDSSDAALNSLRHMKDLSAKAWQGMGAGALGTVTSNLPSGLGGTAGEATELLKNEQLRGALQQLKQIFTGSQSEKESAMLIELQGSINAPDNVRQGIYDRAIELVNDRVKKSAARQEAIANRSMYQPGGMKKGEGQGSDIKWSIVK